VNAALVNFLAIARFAATDAKAGSIFGLFIIAATAGEVALALAIVITWYRRKQNLDIQGLEGLHG